MHTRLHLLMLLLGLSKVEKAQDILILFALASGEGSDEPSNLHSLARAFTSPIYKVWV